MCHHAAFVGSTCTSRPDHSSECKCLRAKLSGPRPFKKMSIDRGTAEYEMLDWDDSIPPHRRQDYAARQQRWQPITTENVLVSEYKIKWVYPYRHLISKGNIAIWKMYHLVRSPDPSNLPSPPKEWLM